MPTKKYFTEEERRAGHLAAAKRRHASDPEPARARGARWREAHREEMNKSARDRRAANPEAAREAQRRWRESNAEKRREYSRHWQEANKEKRRNNEARRRARKYGSDSDNLTHGEWLDILEEFDNCCAYCQARGVELQQEHMTPLSRGGRHVASNVVPACGSCNRRKYVKTIFEFLEVSR